jgi:hypothetical protein
LRRFLEKNAIFLSRQARDKHRKSSTKSMFFLGCGDGGQGGSGRKMNAIFVLFYLTMISLPRQARDKHRKTRKKSGVFLI